MDLAYIYLFNFEDIIKLGFLLYVDYFFFCLLAGVLLMISAVSAIVLTYEPIEKQTVYLNSKFDIYFDGNYKRVI